MVRSSLLREISRTIAKEEDLSAQCLWQHYLLQSTGCETLGSILMQLAINASMWAEIIEQTLACLGQPLPAKQMICLEGRPNGPEEMLQWDRDRLDGIIASSKRVLALARKGGDCLLTETFEELLSHEAEHRAMLEGLHAPPAAGGSTGNLARESRPRG